MKKKLILFNVLITSIALVLFFVLGLAVTRNNNISLAEKTVKNYTEIYAQNYNGNIDFVQETDPDIRLTLVADDGKVLADSRQVNTELMENHFLREEIKSAFNNNPKIAIRYSETTGTELMYYALKVPTTDSFVFIRVAIPIASIDSYVYKSLPLLVLILFCVVVLSLLLSTKIIKKLLQPFVMVKNSLQAINDGEFLRTMPISDYDEINAMLVEINDISQKVERSMTEIKEESTKLDFVINNIGEGIFAIDKSFNLCLINIAAKNIFKVKGNLTGNNLNYLTFNKAITKSIEDCLQKKQNTIFQQKINERTYNVTVKNLGKGWQNDETAELAVVFLNDITNAKNSENLRSEFFANASHELKTPLTSIKGFNELLQIGNKDAVSEKYIKQIAAESDRMLTLIEDMLKLSQLENIKEPEKAEVDLKKISNEVTESLAPLIAAKKVTVNISGEGTVQAESNHIYELIKNLSENAIKYNIENGKVDISIKSSKNETVFEIADTGIGIEPAHQSRIFERFYRIEKSRTRATGGTGLGLAIVKHICSLYNAGITLKSKAGSGTTITIVFFS